MQQFLKFLEFFAFCAIFWHLYKESSFILLNYRFVLIDFCLKNKIKQIWSSFAKIEWSLHDMPIVQFYYLCKIEMALHHSDKNIPMSRKKIPLSVLRKFHLICVFRHNDVIYSICFKMKLNRFQEQNVIILCY